jgi:hypothetical protein
VGLSIDKATFTEADYRQFSRRLWQNLELLKHVLQDPAFGGERQSWGAEVELYIVGTDGCVLPINQAMQRQHSDPRLTLELNCFNLEYNLAPVFESARPFSELQKDLDLALGRLAATAARQQARIVPIGICPTLRVEDFGPHWMTDLPRYHALCQGLKRLGGGDFKIHIDGDPPLLLKRSDVTMEGANTSFQFHYRVVNRDFVDVYNALLLASPAVMGLACNSPTLFGHRLWHETRVPLFKHSIDSRTGNQHWRQPARVSFGQGWARRSAYELFAETAAIHPALLPVCSITDYRAQLKSGKAPDLDELRMHHNSVWPWLRPVYDPSDGGHLRLELRALPAGPSSIDMFANAAFYIGLAEGLRPQLETVLPAMPFAYAKHNFYRAAQYGHRAQLVWPDLKHQQLREISLLELVRQLMPVARGGLQRIGIAEAEIDIYLGVIEERLDTACTGSSWQLAILDQLAADGMDPVAASQLMLQHYIKQVESAAPVSRWSLL